PFSRVPMKHLPDGLAVIAIIVLAILLIVQRHEVGGLHREVAEVRSDVALMTAETANAERKISELRARLDLSEGLKTSLVTPESLPPITTSISRTRALLDNDYPALFRRLKLSPDELDTLRDLLAERAMRAFQ